MVRRTRRAAQSDESRRPAANSSRSRASITPSMARMRCCWARMQARLASFLCTRLERRTSRRCGRTSSGIALLRLCVARLDHEVTLSCGDDAVGLGVAESDEEAPLPPDRLVLADRHPDRGRAARVAALAHELVLVQIAAARLVQAAHPVVRLR